MAVLEGRFITSVPLIIMAIDAHVVRPEAVESGLRAAVHTLPVDLLIAVFRALCLPGADLFQQTFLTQKVFRLALDPVRIGCVLDAVDQAAEVGLLALEALVEGASMSCERLWVFEVDIVFVEQSSVTQETLVLRIDQGLLLDNSL